jgi:hypothetical protein
MYASNHVIRMAGDDDALALRRIAKLDSRDPLTGPVLIGEIAGTPVAAISLSEDRVIADPFVPTDHLRIALRARAKGLRAVERTPSLADRLREGVPVAAATSTARRAA